MSPWELPCGDMDAPPPLLMLTRTLSWWTSHCRPDPAMGSRLLCWATFCLLGTGESSANQAVLCVCVCVCVCVMITFIFFLTVPTGHTGAGLSQSPRHRVTGRGQAVVLRCDPISGHQVFYWYWQMLGQGPEFLTYFQRKDAPMHRGCLVIGSPLRGLRARTPIWRSRGQSLGTRPCVSVPAA